MTPRQKRAAAVKACEARFLGKPFEVASKRECVRLIAHALHHAGVKVGPLKGANYTTLAGAVRTLKKRGFKDLIEAVDSLGLKRIPPASAIAGDIIALPSGDAFGCALTLAVGNGRVMGWLEGSPLCRAMQPTEYLAAWRLV